MKRIFFYITLLFLCSFEGIAQKLSLTDLTTLCSKKNWEDINQALLAKGWEYYDSEKGNTYKYNTITWSFGKEHYNDEAQAWFYLYTYEGFPNKVSYSVFNKESYSLIQNSISSGGFKLIKSDIEDNEVISKYGNNTYTVEIKTEKRKDNDWSKNSITAYNITVIKKSGIYDADNGKKTEYYYDDNIKAEYTLLNGKINGQLKTYHANGRLKKVGNFSNGIENGLFKEYDDDGNIEVEYSMSNGEFNGALKTYNSNGTLKKSGSFQKGKAHGNFNEFDQYGNKEAEYAMANGEKNGILKIYKEGKIDVSTTYKDDIRNGQQIEYYYNDETNKLQLKNIGEYLDDKKDGAWKLYYVDDNNSERLLRLETYTGDIKNGKFQDFSGDSLIFGSYRNDELHGDYKVYLDVGRMIFGGVINTDTAALKLIVDGSYFEGLKTGYWKNYDFTGALNSEGKFSEGQETGEWKYYHRKWDNGEGGLKPYSEQLFLIENYKFGELEGKSTRFSYLEKEKFPCSEIDENENPLDTCSRLIYKKVFETKYYKNGKLNGPSEYRDSLNEIIAKGVFKDDLQEGEWFHRYSISDGNFFVYQKGNYIGGEREGQWIEYYTEGEIAATFNYKNGYLHGEYTVWNNQNKPKEIKQFKYGKLTELVVYDNLGMKPKRKYEIYDEKGDTFKCRKTDYSDNGYSSQEYWVKKEMDIDYNMFEFIFLMAINKNLTEGTYGYKDGLYEEFNTIKKPVVIGKYFKKNKIGLWTFYYYEQNVVVQLVYTNNSITDEKYYLLSGDSKFVSKSLMSEGKFRLTANPLSDIIYTLPLGTEVTILSKEDDYYKVKYKGKIGYVNEIYFVSSNLSTNVNVNFTDLFSGKFVFNDIENGITEERKIKDGLRNGKTVYIDNLTKKTIKKEAYKNGELN